MSSWDVEIIAATTESVISDAFTVIGTETLVAGELGADADEGIKIQYSHDGSTWQDLYLNGVLQEVTEYHSMISLVAGRFRAVKTTTANPVSVVLWKTEDVT